MDRWRAAASPSTHSHTYSARKLHPIEKWHWSISLMGYGWLAGWRARAPATANSFLIIANTIFANERVDEHVWPHHERVCVQHITGKKNKNPTIHSHFVLFRESRTRARSQSIFPLRHCFFLQWLNNYHEMSATNLTIAFTHLAASLWQYNQQQCRRWRRWRWEKK